MDGQASHDGVDGLHTFSTDRFEEGDILGEGQNATVYLVFDFELQRTVALKIARGDTIVKDLALGGALDEALRDAIGEINQGPQAEYTLLREARLAAAVDHPGVVKVLEVGRFQDNGRMAVVMPVLAGDQLPSTAPWRSILDCVLQLAGGLAALHEAGIVHRDLKPDNILYDDACRPCIGDLGLACRLSDEDAMSHFAGSSKWMAPEVLARRGGGGVQNDVFGFCMIAFEMFFGHPPFVDADAKREGRISDIKRTDDMPASLRDVLVKGLAPDPGSRWTSMREVMAALELVRQPPKQPRAPKQRRPKRRWLGAAAAVGLSVGLGVGMCVTLPEAKADACEEVSRELVDFWNDDVQAELRVVLGTRRAGDYLESFASRWVAVRAKECDAAKRNDQSDRASPCTTSVRSHLNATINTLRTPYRREGVDFERMLAALPEPEYCLDHPEDAEYGLGGFFELQTLDIELEARLGSGDLEVAERLQADYMLAAREISATYDIARAIYWRAELHRLRGELDQAEGDFKRAYSEAQNLGAMEFEGEAMMKLAAVAGAKGDLAALDERAFVARTVFAQRRPGRIAELLQVQGLALVEQDPAQRDRGLALLRDAVEMREAQHSHYGGSRERVGEALEALARGLIAAEQADEAVNVATQSLAIHELEYGGLTKRAHELRRLLFVAQVQAALVAEAERTQLLLLNHLAGAEKHDAYFDEVIWVTEVYWTHGQKYHAQTRAASALRYARQLGDAQQIRRMVALLEVYEAGPPDEIPTAPGPDLATLPNPHK